MLPAVQPPSAGFILQLFLIPLLIVSIIVVVWLLFTWLASAGSNPSELVRDIKKLNAASWQRAVTLADILRNPEHDKLKDDKALAKELADLLDAEITGAQMSDPQLKLRIYLCRILGEFRVTTGVPALLRAARERRAPEEISVQASAIEALALLAKNVKSDELRGNDELLKTLIEASQSQAEGKDEGHRFAEMRSRAAFALGVLGGDQALAPLKTLLADPYPNTRYNAATGLARHGDWACADVLLEMLDPKNQDALEFEQTEADREIKRASVMLNGLRAVELLETKYGEEQPLPDELSKLRDAVTKLKSADVPRAVSAALRE